MTNRSVDSLSFQEFFNLYTSRNNRVTCNGGDQNDVVNSMVDKNESVLEVRNSTVNTDNSSSHQNVNCSIDKLSFHDFFQLYTSKNNTITCKTGDKNGQNQVSNTVSSVFDKTESSSDQLNFNLRFYDPKSFDNDLHNSSLPIHRVRAKLLSLVDSNQVVVVRGPTGCGKTTQVPQYILDWHLNRNLPCKIIVTQPRRIAAITMARRVCEERRIKLPSLVGYHVGLNNKTEADTKITYCTTRVLLKKLIKKKSFDDYTHIVVDEVHERDQDMDFTLLVIKKLLKKAGRVKLVVMSATFDVSKFSRYFGIELPALSKLLPAPVIEVENETIPSHPINIKYLSDLHYLGKLPEVTDANVHIDKDFYKLTLALVKNFDDLEQNKPNVKCRGAVLVFLPGLNEIEELHSILKPCENSHKWKVFPLHSSITLNEQQMVFRNVQPDERKIILATNIAESSITVPDIVYVIDFCRVKHLVTNPKSNYTSLQLCWASKSNCIQRAGRSGRVSEGYVYRLVPKTMYESLFDDEIYPEILRCPLANLVLYSKILDMGSPKSILAMALDPPDISNLESTILTLKEVGALFMDVGGVVSCTDGDITLIGEIMANLPLDIHASKLIILGYFFGMLEDCIIIAAALSLKSIFSTPFKKKIDSYLAKWRWADGSRCDLMASLNAYKYWLNQVNLRYFQHSSGGEKKWSERHFLQTQTLKEMSHLIFDIKERLKGCRIDELIFYDPVTSVVWADWEKPLILKILIAGAFYPYYFVHKKDRKSWEDILKYTGGWDPFSTIYLRNWPQNQPGRLYSKKFRDIFELCSKDVHVFSDGSKIYLQFPQTCSENERRTWMQGRIPVAMYRALKMKKLEQKIKIDLLSPDEAERKAEELNLINDPFTCFGNTHGFSPTGKLKYERVLPGLGESEIKIRICNIINPKQFWARYYDDEQFTILTHELQSEYKVHHLDHELPLEGNLYITCYGDDKAFVRVVVKEVFDSQQEALVFYIDSGETERVRVSKLLMFADKNHAKRIFGIPARAFECTLCNLEPSLLKNPFGCWTPQAIKFFSDMVSGEQCIASVYSVMFGVVSVELTTVDDSSSEKPSINQLLIDNGYAEYAEENFFSQQDHKTRMRFPTMNEGEKLAYSNAQTLQLCWDSEPDPPHSHECRNSVVLKGPMSPLEITLEGLTRGTETKTINIEGNSVNSVLLDANPHLSHECLVVSTDIRECFDNSLVLFETSVMPNIGGFAALVSLMFAPKAELKVHPLNKRYVGTLCGLGYNLSNGKSLFSDHDMYISFDVEITNEDIIEVNNIRKCMNHLISSNSHVRQSLDVNKFCKSIQDSVRKLFGLSRKPLKQEFDSSFDWEGIIDSSEDVIKDERELFRLHTTIQRSKRCL